MEIFTLIAIILFAVIVHNSIYRKYIFKNFSYHCSFSTSLANEGDEIEFTEEITNSKLLPVPWLKTVLSTSKWLEFSDLASAVSDSSRLVTSFFSIKSYCRIKRTWKIKCLKRGIFSIDNISVIASDILGTKKYSCFINMDEIKAQITVLPGSVPAEYEGALDSMICGDYFVKNKLISDPFFYNGIREYTQTDPYRSINWYATAKENRLMVNKNDFTTLNYITLIMNIQSREADFDSIAYDDYTERCIRTCAFIVKQNCFSGIPVRFFCNCCNNEKNGSIQTEYVQDESGCTELLKIMSSVQLNIYNTFDKYLTDLIDRLDNTQVVIVSSYVSSLMNIMSQRYPHITVINPGEIISTSSSEEDTK